MRKRSFSVFKYDETKFLTISKINMKLIILKCCNLLMKITKQKEIQSYMRRNQIIIVQTIKHFPRQYDRELLRKNKNVITDNLFKYIFKTGKTTNLFIWIKGNKKFVMC